jgi:hypothetical protein
VPTRGCGDYGKTVGRVGNTSPSRRLPLVSAQAQKSGQVANRGSNVKGGAGGFGERGEDKVLAKLDKECERLGREACKSRQLKLDAEQELRATNIRARLGKLGLLDDITLYNLNRTFLPGVQKP